MLSRGDHVLVLESGRFAAGWGEMGKMLGLEIEALKGDWRRAVDPAAVEERLKRDKAAAIKAILVVQIDTASGVVNDIPAIRKAIDAAKHPALLMVDCVASLGCMPFAMDAWGVDVAMCGSQKGLMTPPGLAFVAAGDRARVVHKSAGLRTLYWDWTFREGEIHYQKYCGTPPEHLLFGLRKAMDMLLAEGLQNAIRRHELLAEATRAAVAQWTKGQVLAFNIINPAERANSITNILMQGCDPQAAAGLLPRQVRRDPGRGSRRPVGHVFPHRPHGPRQRADGAGHPGGRGNGSQGSGRPAWLRRRAGGRGVPGTRGDGLRCVEAIESRVRNNPGGAANDSDGNERPEKPAKSEAKLAPKRGRKSKGGDHLRWRRLRKGLSARSAQVADELGLHVDLQALDAAFVAEA